MKRRMILIVLTLALVLPTAGAQQLTTLEEDFEVFFDVLGQDLLPHIQQAASSGEGIGASAIPANRRFYIAGSLGGVFSDGLKESVEQGNFEVLNVPNLIDESIGELPGATNAYESFLPYPITRASFGIRLPKEIELLTMVSGVPAGLTQWGLKQAGLDGAGMSALNIGLRGRMPLIQEQGKLPGLSMGLGYSYSGVNLSYKFPDDFSQDFGGEELTMEGDLDIASRVHTSGLDLTLSKTLAVFVPYLRFSSYYQASSFTGEITDFDATVGSSNYQDQGGKDPKSTTDSYDFALKSALGFEINLGGFGILAEGSYSNASHAFAAHAGLRLMF